MLNDLERELSIRLRGISLNVDLVGSCCLACPTCAVGSIGNRSDGRMSYDTFLDILGKACGDEGLKIRRMQLYAYTDPCLHPELHRFVHACTTHGIPSYISTMLQTTKCDFREVIEARPREFRISFPGWERMHVYQKGARPEVFDRKIREVCKLPRYPETCWTMAFHVYRDNQHELPRARALAEHYGLKFVALPAIFMVAEKTTRKDYTAADREIISHLIETPEEGAARMKPSNQCVCWKQVTIRSNGTVMLCQLVFRDEFKMGYFGDLPFLSWLKLIRTHEFCGECMATNSHRLQECFADFVTSPDPVAEANKKRRK